MLLQYTKEKKKLRELFKLYGPHLHYYFFSCLTVRKKRKL